MDIDMNTFANYVLRENIRLKAKTTAMEYLIKTLLKAQYPNNYEAVIKEYDSIYQQKIQDFLIEHPFLDDDWNEFLSKMKD